MENSKQPAPSSNAFKYVWYSPWVRVFVFLVVFYLIYLLYGQIKSVVIDFLIAFLIAYLANPLLNCLKSKKIKRGLGVLLVILLFVGIFFLAGLLLVTVSQQLVQLFQKIPDLVGSLGTILDNILSKLTNMGVSGLENAKEQILESIQTYFENLGQNIVPILQNALGSTGTLFSGLLSIGGVVGQIFLIMLVSIYLMIDYKKINETLISVFPIPWQDFVKEIGSLLGTSVGGYVRGQLLIALFIGVFVWLGLSILHIPNAAAIGFLAGTFNIVPYLGPIVGATPALLLAMTMPNAPWVSIGVVAVFVIANQIESNILSPYILSKTTDLHPVTVLVAILVGVALLGFVGALVAVPLVAFVKLLMQKYYYPSRVYQQGP